MNMFKISSGSVLLNKLLLYGDIRAELIKKFALIYMYEYALETSWYVLIDRTPHRTLSVWSVVSSFISQTHPFVSKQTVVSMRRVLLMR